MIGLVLVTHGRLALELRHAMEHVVGPQPAVATVCIGPEDDMEGRRADIRARIADVQLLAKMNGAPSPRPHCKIASSFAALPSSAS